MNLSVDDIMLVPIVSEDRANLKRVFQTEDVLRFYFGIHDRKPPSEEIDKFVENHISRAQSLQGGQRISFDGGWLIRFKGEVAGHIKLTAVEANFMPQEVEGEFKKRRSNDLYLAVGYSLLPEMRGHNIVHQSLLLALNFAKKNLKAKYVFASTNNMNKPSQAVLTKAGFLPIFSDDRRTKFFIDLK